MIPAAASSTSFANALNFESTDGIAYRGLAAIASLPWPPALVTTSFLAGGGDLYAFPGSSSVTDTGHIDAEVFVQYIEALSGAVLNVIDDGMTIIR